MINPATKCSCVIDVIAGRSDDSLLYNDNSCPQGCRLIVLKCGIDDDIENENQEYREALNKDDCGDDQQVEDEQNRPEEKMRLEEIRHIEDMIVTRSFVGE